MLPSACFIKSKGEPELELLLYLIIRLVEILLTVLSFAMLLRAIMSFLAIGEESAFEDFLYALTEPLIIPVRALFQKLGWFEGLPLDMSFFVTVVLIEILRTVLDFIPIGI